MQANQLNEEDLFESFDESSDESLCRQGPPIDWDFDWSLPRVSDDTDDPFHVTHVEV